MSIVVEYVEPSEAVSYNFWPLIAVLAFVIVIFFLVKKHART